MSAKLSWGGSLTRFKKLTQDTSKDVEKDIEKLLKNEVKKITADAKRRTPARTGRLRRAWRNKRLNAQTYEITNRVPYGIFLERGTRKIRPHRMLDNSLRAGRVRMRKGVKQIMNKQQRKWS